MAKKNRTRSNRRETHAIEQIASVALFQLDLAFSWKVAGWLKTFCGFYIEPVNETELEAREQRYAYATRRVIRIKPRGWERSDYVELALIAPPVEHGLLPNEGCVFHHALDGGAVRFSFTGELVIGGSCLESRAIHQYMRLDEVHRKLMVLLHN